MRECQREDDHLTCSCFRMLGSSYFGEEIAACFEKDDLFFVLCDGLVVHCHYREEVRMQRMHQAEIEVDYLLRFPE